MEYIRLFCSEQLGDQGKVNSTGVLLPHPYLRENDQQEGRLEAKELSIGVNCVWFQ